MKKLVPVLVFFITSLVSVFPQDSLYSTVQETTKRNTSFKEKLYYGGYLNLSFGSYMVIGAEPMIGYKLTPKWSAGIKVRYDYIRDKRYPTTHESSQYGGSVFTRYRLLPQLYVHAEYAAYNYELFNAIGESERLWIPFLFVGAGYSQNIGGRTWLNAQVLFDVLQHERSPYNDWEPFYSVGVGVGF